MYICDICIYVIYVYMYTCTFIDVTSTCRVASLPHQSNLQPKMMIFILYFYFKVCILLLF